MKAVDVDEIVSRCGHNYITLFHDLRAGRLLHACEGVRPQKRRVFH